MYINKLLKEKGLLRINYLGNMIPTAAGILFLLTSLICWSGFFIFNWGDPGLLKRFIFLTTIIGTVGLIDDMQGEKDFQGFAGHFKGLLTGKLTTGMFKAIIAFLTILFVIDRPNIWIAFINLGLVLFMTNFINLLDLRPGRAIKGFIILTIILLISKPFYYIYFFPIFIIVIFYLPFELKGKIMIGDTGSNLLGAVLGFAFSQAYNLTGKIIILVLLITFNMLAEKFSFTRIIARNKYLNWFDQLGRNK